MTCSLFFEVSLFGVILALLGHCIPRWVLRVADEVDILYVLDSVPEYLRQWYGIQSVLLCFVVALARLIVMVPESNLVRGPESDQVRLCSCNLQFFIWLEDWNETIAFELRQSTDYL